MIAGRATVTVNAPPDAVYGVVSDLTRTGEWSPECQRVEWLDGDVAPGQPGARFRGHNSFKGRVWTMDGVVDEAVPGRAFSFHTERDGNPRTKWGYVLEPADGGGTRLTEWYERVATLPLLARVAERLWLGGRQEHNDRNVRDSLERIKTVVESGTAPGTTSG